MTSDEDTRKAELREAADSAQLREAAEREQAELREEEALRERAVKQLRKKRDFFTHLLVYILVNGFLVGIWAINDVHGFFWPMFPIVGWGIAVVLNAWDVFSSQDFGEEQIQREIDRLTRPR